MLVQAEVALASLVAMHQSLQLPQQAVAAQRDRVLQGQEIRQEGLDWLPLVVQVQPLADLALVFCLIRERFFKLCSRTMRLVAAEVAAAAAVALAVLAAAAAGLIVLEVLVALAEVVVERLVVLVPAPRDRLVLAEVAVAPVAPESHRVEEVVLAAAAAGVALPVSVVPVAAVLSSWHGLKVIKHDLPNLHQLPQAIRRTGAVPALPSDAVPVA